MKIYVEVDANPREGEDREYPEIADDPNGPQDAPWYPIRDTDVADSAAIRGERCYGKRSHPVLSAVGLVSRTT